jgi:excinuclease UvrABC nuclease subunit
MSRWKVFDITDSSTLPTTAGVYALFDANGLVYLGSSGCLRIRALRHPKKQKFRGTLITEGRYSLNRKYGEHLMREARLIRRLRPRLNGRPRLRRGGRR